MMPLKNDGLGAFECGYTTTCEWKGRCDGGLWRVRAGSLACFFAPCAGIIDAGVVWRGFFGDGWMSGVFFGHGWARETSRLRCGHPASLRKGGTDGFIPTKPASCFGGIARRPALHHSDGQKPQRPQRLNPTWRRMLHLRHTMLFLRLQ